MRAVAVIPARGGSKGVHRKNLRRVNGQTLISRSVRSCLDAERIKTVIVSSDDPEILTEAESAGARPLLRPDSISGDLASSESALLHAVDALDLATDFDIILLVQCTSPFISPSDLDDAVQLLATGGYDSVFAAVETSEFLWCPTEDGLRGVNHSHEERKRRQDLPKQLKESGAFYAAKLDGFLSHHHRFFGNIGAVLVDPVTSIEIDNEFELQISNAIAQVVEEQLPVDQPLRGVKAIVWDFDGVHTDDSVFVADDGSETVRVSRADGMGVRRLRDRGVPTLILSSETNPVVKRRAEKLEVESRSGTFEKLRHLTEWCANQKLTMSDVAYVGNDLNDLECMRAVGFPIAVANAHYEVKNAAVLVSSSSGGDGAVREIIEIFLRSNPESAPSDS